MLLAATCICVAEPPSPRLHDLTSEWETPPVRCLWNFFNLYNPKIIQEPDGEYLFKMWFFGWAVEKPAQTDEIFFARSKDLLAWEVYSGENGWDSTMNPKLWVPVLVPGKERFDSAASGDPSVVLKDGVFHMAYSSVGFDFVPHPNPLPQGEGAEPHPAPPSQGEKTEDRIYLVNCIMGATSTDGIHWKKSPEPILIWEKEFTNRWALVDGKIGPVPEEYYGSYHRPSLLFDEGRWRLWFDYFHPGTFLSLGNAENSSDFLNPLDWKVIRAEKEPLLRDWPNPAVIKINEKYLAFSDATGFPVEMGGDRRQITLAESSDGVEWKELGHIRPEGMASSHVPEPFVVERDGARWLYLFYSWKPERKEGEAWDYRYKEIRFIRKQLNDLPHPSTQ